MRFHPLSQQTKRLQPMSYLIKFFRYPIALLADGARLTPLLIFITIMTIPLAPLVLILGLINLIINTRNETPPPTSD
jgi:hypothetical protein